jgi:hypothetical protein
MLHSEAFEPCDIVRAAFGCTRQLVPFRSEESLQLTRGNIMENFNHALRAVAAAVMTLTVALSAPPASASDYTVYPGTDCVKLGGGANITRSFGSIQNANPVASLFVDCNSSNNVRVRISQGWVITTDRHPNDAVICSLVQVFRRFQDSDLIFWFNAQNANGAGNGVQVLHYGPGDPNFSTGAASSNFYTCHIPATSNGEISQIHSYAIIEE